jgi:hypothetical protein
MRSATPMLTVTARPDGTCPKPRSRRRSISAIASALSGIRQHDEEFLAAPPHQHVRSAQRSAQDAATFASTRSPASCRNRRSRPLKRSMSAKSTASGAPRRAASRNCASSVSRAALRAGGSR